VARPLSVLMFGCYAEVCMERLVRDVPWRACYQSLCFGLESLNDVHI